LTAGSWPEGQAEELIRYFIQNVKFYSTVTYWQKTEVTIVIT
jgi:hypothetical protein